MQFPYAHLTHRRKSWRGWCGARQERCDAWLLNTKALLSAGQDFGTCMFPPSASALGPVEGEVGDATSCFVCPANGGCQSPEMSARVKLLSTALNSLVALIYFKCFSPFRVSALCQWDGTGLLLSLKCGNFSAYLPDKLYVGCSKCSLISPADCLLSVVYLTL